MARRPIREVPLVEQPPRPRRRKRRQVRDGPSAALLRQPDQRKQQLGGRLGVRQSPVARTLRRVEKPRELGEAEPRDPPGEERPREPHRVEDGGADPRAGQPLGLTVEKGEIEARVVRDEDGVAREGEKAPHRVARSRCPAELVVPKAGQRAHSSGDRKPWVDQGLELRVDLEAAEAHGSDLADSGLPGPQSRRLEVDHHVRCVLELERRARRFRERDRISVPREPRVGLDDVCQQRARERDRRLAEGEEAPSCLFRQHRSALLLDKLHEPIGRV